jgi:ADP-ribosyl-[dinitrogen reductase] hydrolase
MTMSAIFFGWLLPGIGLIFFAIGAFLNVSVMFGLQQWIRDARAAGSHVSTVPFVPGVIGAVAMWNGPFDWMPPLFWVPLVLDVGCLPLIVLTLYASIARGDPEGKGDAAAEGEPDAAQLERQRTAAANARVAEEKQARTDLYYRSIAGCLLGTAVGDALGLPFEGLSARRRARMFRRIDRYYLLPFGRGLCSDDTEHTIMVAQALMETAGYSKARHNADQFRSSLACAMRLWLLGLPAGIGMATLKGILKLWMFLPRRWQGVFSAGNAPSMRSALIGVFWNEDMELLRLHVHAATALTHSDPKAEQAALAVAEAARMSAMAAGSVLAADYASHMRSILGQQGAELADLIDRAANSVQAGEATPAFARTLGLERGVTGYAFHTVPVALHAWLAHPGNYREALLAAIECGGDTDTVAAITGAIAGAGSGPEGVPAEWLARLAEWPHTVTWMKQLAQSLAKVRSDFYVTGAPSVPLSKLMLRNLFFLLVVLAHGFRRLLPPY